MHEFCRDRAVRRAEALIDNLAQRIGAVPCGGPVPSAIQHQRWSSLNVPLIWGAARASPSIPLIEWLVSRASPIHAPVQFHGGLGSVSDSVRHHWSAVREVMIAWLWNRGFSATRPGQHLFARAHDFKFPDGCVLDARVALLETAFVLITLEQGRNGIPPVGDVGRSAPRRTTRSIPPVVPTRKLGTIGRGGLVREVLSHVEVLGSHVAREAHRRGTSMSPSQRRRLGSCIGLVPLMVLHQTRASGSVGRDELAKQVDDFAQRHRTALLRDSSCSGVEARGGTTNKSEAKEQARKGRAALCPGKN